MIRRERAAVFLSGGGRTLANLLLHRQQHDLPIDVPLVIGSRKGLKGLEIAKDAGIDRLVVPKDRQTSDDDYRHAMFEPVRKSNCTMVIMAGFLKHVLIPDDFRCRVINIHPSLLPAFGGPGMYGQHVHQAVLDRGVQVTGCTVHYVDNQYDNGPIVLQRWCEVAATDTATTLAARVFELEKAALPDAIRKLASD